MKSKAFILSVLMLFPAGSGQASEAVWTGLWQITQQTPNGPVEFSLHIPGPGGSAVFYGGDWLTLPAAEFRAEGDALLLNWQAKGANVVFEGSRRGDRISGKWRLLHPQYQEEGTFSGRRVLDAAKWSPLAAVPTGAVADLNALLASHASDFEAYWDGTFKPDYWVFLGAEVSAGPVRERLKDPNFAAASARLAKALEEMARGFPSKLDGFKLPGTVILLPVGPSDRFTLRFVQDKSFLTLNPDRLLAEPGPSSRELARGLLAALAEARFAGEHRSFKLLRAGLPALGLRGLDLASNEGEALGLGGAEWNTAHGRIGEIKKKITARHQLTPTETAVAGLDFAGFLARDMSFAEIFNAPPVKLDRELGAYLKQ